MIHYSEVVPHQTSELYNINSRSVTKYNKVIALQLHRNNH